MNSDVTINVTVQQGGTIDADLENATVIETTVEQGGVLEAVVTGGGKGDKGDQGDQGIQGVKGDTGDTGAGVPNGGTTAQVLRKASNTDQDTEWHSPAKADVGLSNVDNTSDANKPVSTAQAAADAVIQADIDAHEANTSNPHSVTKSQVGLGNADNTSDANKPVSTAQQTALDGKQNLDSDLTAIAGLDSSTSGAIASDGAGWIKKTYAQFKTALGLVKGDVGLGNVDNTSDSTKNAAVASLTNKDLTSGTNTFPTLNQNTTGSAAKLTTARNIDGQSFDGSADITVIAPGTHAATGKTTPVDADEIPLVDSAASNVLKKLTWANLKATAKTYFDTLYQPLNAALTSISGLSPSNDDIIQRKSGAWTNRTMAQLIADLGALATTFQPLDSDLTTIAGLTATTDNFIQSKSSAWASRTPTQVTADLNVFTGDSGAGGLKGLVPAPVAGDASKALFGDGTFKTIPGGGDALTTNPLSQFAATTSLQLKNTISDETGSGALVFANSPALVTPTGIVKGDVGLGSVDNTADSAKNVLSATKLTTSRNIDGQGFDGSANITVIAPGTHAATTKATPADADELPLVDTAASNVLKNLTWANLKATLKTYFDSVTTTLTNKTFDSTSPTAFFNPGVIMPHGGRTAPTGWLLCDGSAVSRSTYSGLFAVLCESMGTFTVTIASPGVVTFVAHGFQTGEQVYLTTTGALPTGLSANTLYYAIRVTADTFQLATSRANAYAGTPINTSGTQSGTHTLRWCPYGLGDGSTTFNVPDYRGRSLVGADAMGGTAASRLTNASSMGGVVGNSGGTQTTTTNVAVATQPTFTVNSHTHPLSDTNGWARATITTGKTVGQRTASGVPSWTSTHNVSGTLTGESVAHTDGIGLIGTTDATSGVATTRTADVALTNNAVATIPPTLISNVIIKT